MVPPTNPSPMANNAVSQKQIVDMSRLQRDTKSILDRFKAALQTFMSSAGISDLSMVDIKLSDGRVMNLTDFAKLPKNPETMTMMQQMSSKLTLLSKDTDFMKEAQTRAGENKKGLAATKDAKLLMITVDLTVGKTQTAAASAATTNTNTTAVYAGGIKIAAAPDKFTPGQVKGTGSMASTESVANNEPIDVTLAEIGKVLELTKNPEGHSYLESIG